MDQDAGGADSGAAEAGIGPEEAAVIAHDMRNPLNAAITSLEVARATGGDEHFDRADRSLRRLNDIIDHMLALGQGTAAGLEPEDVSLKTAAERAWDTTATESATLVVDDDLEFQADRSALDTLLSNLFDNAVTHAGEDVTVTVGTLPDDAGFFVEDDGPGIDDEAEDPFEFGYTTESQRTGYGLSIVARNADVHGWEVSLTDGEDGGARFEFVL